MALTTARPVMRSDALPDEKLGSVAIVVLCGCAYLCVALAFSSIDRYLGRFGFEAGWWAFWGALGFGAGAARFHADAGQGRRLGKVLMVIAGLLTLFPGFLMFRLDRWAAFLLLLVTAARAVGMRSRRDFYYALASIVPVSLLVATHSRADWTTWFYLGPAWLLMALALAWDYAAGVQLGAMRKGLLTLGFVGFCLAFSALVFALLPQPQILGFGFVPPGTSAPGRVKTDAGAEPGNAGARGGQQAAQPETVLGQAVERMRKSLKDPALPDWQRSAVEGLVAAGEALMRARGDPGATTMFRRMTPAEAQAYLERLAAVQSFLEFLLRLLMLAIAAWVAWRLRWRVGIGSALIAAWALARSNPSASMRCSAYATRWFLARGGHPMRPGQSAMEHIQSAPNLPVQARDWLERATRLYCAERFGGARATAETARYVRRAVDATVELMRGARPRTEKP